MQINTTNFIYYMFNFLLYHCFYILHYFVVFVPSLNLLSCNRTNTLILCLFFYLNKLVLLVNAHIFRKRKQNQGLFYFIVCVRMSSILYLLIDMVYKRSLRNMAYFIVMSKNKLCSRV